MVSSVTWRHTETVATQQYLPGNEYFLENVIKIFYFIKLTSTSAHNSHQSCIRVVSPNDGQVMPETYRDF
jgi:hypothetical protein